ncbi:MAG: DUF1848 family protein [Roseiflexaceae bacterium]|nr:DUF1848 family protein [Roseiflexaceae bacterium]
MQWRYDPIIYTDRTDEQWQCRDFCGVCVATGRVTERCYFSLPRHLRQSCPQHAPGRIKPFNCAIVGMRKLRQLALERIAANHGITLYTCACIAAIEPI